MDQFVTTYRKDFLWPYVRIFGLKPQQDTPSAERQATGEMCVCKCAPRSSEQRAKLLGPNVYEQDKFQKLGPNAPLMDPRLYPARVGPPPENETQRFNQPNVFLEKLKLKYPFLYEVLRTASPDDIITRINRDRLRTTYEVDFCHLNEYPSAPYDELLRAAGVSGVSPCPEPVRLPGDPCRPNQKALAFRPAIISKFRPFGAEKCGGPGAITGLGGGGATGGMGSMGMGFGQGQGSANIAGAVGMGPTEYQDAISKLGELIIRDKIHYRKAKTKSKMY